MATPALPRIPQELKDVPYYYTFAPRPDQPERYDQQSAFYNSQSRGVIWLLGGNGAGTTETLLAKAARFIYEQPPPRPDTPFWIIAETYEQVMETCWKEKLFGHGHILEQDIDWDRIDWHRPKNNWPFRVPMKRIPPSRNNWVIEFKSWRQGYGKMMARAIGGFAFVEQFPWSVFTETLRACREYNFPGSKLCEYTPVNPDLSGEIEEMITNGHPPADVKLRRPGARYLPPSWEIYHANTQCAMEAGHVDEEWFYEFFGMIPEDMHDTRMRGLFSSFEGVIYKEFSPEMHLMGDEMWSRLADRNQYWRRGIDWGAGPENPFCCLWGAKDIRTRQWYIFDEYYSNRQDFTTIDHLCEVYDGWEWPNTPLHGSTYADPSSPDNIRIAMKLQKYAPAGRLVDSISIQRARNAVIEGIEHIQYLLKPQVPVDRINPKTGEFERILEPKLFIHRDNCPNLIRELRKYRWRKGPDAANLGRNPVNPAREPLKFDDHACDALRYLCFTDDSTDGGTVESMRKSSFAADAVARNRVRDWREMFPGVNRGSDR